jgi:hypothetical protein
MLWDEPQAFHPPLPDAHQAAAHLAPVFAYVTEARRQPLMGVNIQHLNANETTIQPTTVQAHLDEIYTPGDRHISRNSSRKASHRRQTPRPRGYPCTFEGCEKAFDRNCELK